MKSMDNVTLVNSLSEIFELFTKIYPEMKSQVSGWHKWGDYADSFRGIAIEFDDGKRLLFSVRQFPDQDGWSVSDLYLIPAYVKEIPEKISVSSPAVGIAPVESLEDLKEAFCKMFPEYRNQVIDLQVWRRFASTYRGVMIQLADRKKILFAAEKQDRCWHAKYPILIPALDEDMLPFGEMEQIAMSDVVIFID